jgi:hypothetical protein
MSTPTLASSYWGLQECPVSESSNDETVEVGDKFNFGGGKEGDGLSKTISEITQFPCYPYITV